MFEQFLSNKNKMLQCATVEYCDVGSSCAHNYLLVLTGSLGLYSTVVPLTLAGCQMDGLFVKAVPVHMQHAPAAVHYHFTRVRYAYYALCTHSPCCIAALTLVILRVLTIN